MRVVSGSARGLLLSSVAGLDTRPTSDRVRENLFNMLAPDLPGCRFLDLFGGTGANGIEALSRGAASAVFVDHAAAAVSVIKQNVNAARVSARATVLGMDFTKALRLLADEHAGFDIVFLDPPYRTALADEALMLIADCNLLNPGGYAVVESSRTTPPHAVTGYIVSKSRNYGSAAITFLTPCEGACE